MLYKISYKEIEVHTCYIELYYQKNNKTEQKLKMRLELRRTGNFCFYLILNTSHKKKQN